MPSHAAPDPKRTKKAHPPSPPPCSSPSLSSLPSYAVLLCYSYTDIADPEALSVWFVDICTRLCLTGRVLIATEGVNVNLAGEVATLASPSCSPDGNMGELQRAMDAHPMLKAPAGEPVPRIDYKMDSSCQRPFPDLKVQVVAEIVATGGTMPFQLLSKQKLGGCHLSPSEFHAVLKSYLGDPSKDGGGGATVVGASEGGANTGVNAAGGGGDGGGDASVVGDGQPRGSVAGGGVAGAVEGGDTGGGGTEVDVNPPAKRAKTSVVSPADERADAREDDATQDPAERKAESEAETGDKPLIVIDVRNRKEIEFGRFSGSMNSNTKMFSEWATHFALPRVEQLKKAKVLMYCTGGVRCEKASAFLRSQGVKDVSQLSGGIHRYLEQYGSEGFFQGSNFVFDSRGLMKPEGAKVVAKCFGCSTTEDTLSSDRVCAVCRDQVIICDGCRVQKLGVYFCKDHVALEGAYFPFVDTFSCDELVRQRDTLHAMCQGIFGGKAFRNRRKSLRKQIQRLEARITALTEKDVMTTTTATTTATATAAETATTTATTTATAPTTTTTTANLNKKTRCRSCGRPCASLKALLLQRGHEAESMESTGECQSDCWGFFLPSRREKGYVNLHSGLTSAPASVPPTTE